MATGGLSGNNAAAAIVLASKATTASTDVVLNIQGDQVQNNNNNSSTSGPSFAMPLIPEAAVVQQNSFESSGVSGLTFSNIKKTPSFGSNLRLTELESLSPQVQLTSISGQPSPEIKNFSPNMDRPPKVPTTPRTAVLVPGTTSVFSKAKSRFSEPPVPAGFNPVDDLKKAALMQESQNTPYRASPNNNTNGRSSPYKASPNNNRSSAATTPKDITKTAPVTPKTPLMASPGPGGGGGEEEDEEEEDEDIYSSEKAATLMQSCRKKMKFWTVLEWIALLGVTATFILSLTISKLKNLRISELHLWKWCVLLLVIVCGRLFTDWLVKGLVFLVEKRFILKKKVLYFVYGLKKSVQVCIWLALVLLSWTLFFDGKLKLSKDDNKFIRYVTRALVSSLAGAGIWLLKTLLLKILASSFHVNTFFDRIQESLFHQYVLQVLSGPPKMQLAENIGRTKTIGTLSVRSTTKKGKEGQVQEIDVNKLHKLKQEKVSAWTMKLLCDMVSTTGLSTLSDEIEDLYDEEQKDVEITCEWQAKAAAFRIFKNVAKPREKYIYEEDLLKFLTKEEVANVYPLFEGAVEAGKIKKSMLRNWVVKVYLERKSLGHSLNDAQTAVRELNKIASVIVLVMIVIVWVLLMGIATTQFLVFISSQMLLVVFVFGNMAKTVFEGIIFVFIMHPFDVGDRCLVDNVQMVVEEMNILSTVFLRYDNQKMYFPNSVLATKIIGNFNRSPFMGDAVEFNVNVATSVETIGELKARIKMYIESKPQHWSPNHTVVVLEIVNVHDLKMALYLSHTMNHQNMGEKNNRRSDLVFELKKIFVELKIEFKLLPQEVYVTYAGSPTTAPVVIG
ncbi:hypothetical protein C5167_006598 [Papaver somniferum]|uniref:Mechanosensitive ion channel MscS domain-containing protein n=1 Tax=Papaver somniferum TaxID=3469 RepID=A0A4Y7JI12_PAPSO|nr:mechanosensitive ion channel protein 10-like [Papaver somniferum]RZC59295.1 hypothetical protein C5167_006598 [Papaver somniferum]